MNLQTIFAGAVSAAALAACGGAQAQGQAQATPAGGCDQLPPGAVKAVPAPFDRYMILTCDNGAGQGLGPAADQRWRDVNEGAAALTAGAGGFGWYASLRATPLSSADQDKLRADFDGQISARFLTGSTILSMLASTSSGVQERIYLIVPDTRPGPPAWLVGLQCKGACFSEDADPVQFLGEPAAK